jgi:uncharacterized protein (TIGR02001 family)
MPSFRQINVMMEREPGGEGTMPRGKCWRTLLRVAAVFPILLCAESAAARDEAVEPEPPAAESPEPAAPAGAPAGFDLAFGAAFTSDYISRGITLNGTQPAVQGYIEPSYGLLYANVWASNTQFDDGTPSGAEIDVTGGIRPKFGDLSLNLGYVQYFYAPEEVSPTYGEVFGKADYNITDKFIVGMRVFFAPDFSQTGKTATFVAGGAKVLLPKNFSLYAGVGYQFFEDPHAFEDLAWTAGLTYTWKTLTFDVRYWDTNLSPDECAVRSGFSDGCDARVVGTISWDLTWSKLMSHGLF